MLEIMINMDSTSEYKEGEDTLGGYLLKSFALLVLRLKKIFKIYTEIILYISLMERISIL